MNRIIPTLMLVASALAVPAAAFAAETPPENLAATVICRAASPSEHPNAMMLANHVAMMCKSLPTTVASETKFGPDLTNALTTEQINGAWRAWVNAKFTVPVSGG